VQTPQFFFPSQVGLHFSLDVTANVTLLSVHICYITLRNSPVCLAIFSTSIQFYSGLCYSIQ